MLFAFLCVLLFTTSEASVWYSNINATVSFYTKNPSAKNTICSENINREHWSLNKTFVVLPQILLDPRNTSYVKTGDCWCGVFNESKLNDPNFSFRLLYVRVYNITNTSNQLQMIGHLGFFSQCQNSDTLPRNTLENTQSCRNIQCGVPPTLDLAFQTLAGSPTFCGGGQYPLVPDVASNSSCTWVRIDMPCGETPPPNQPPGNTEMGIIVGVCVGGIVLVGLGIMFVVYQKKFRYAYTAV